ncbi:MAG: hypothetical protein WAT66_08480 [Actinomycetota bacterium]
MTGFLSVLLAVLAVLAYFLTVWAVVRTKEWAKSPRSQAGWLLVTLLLPAVGMVFFWLTEAPQRRNRSRQPPAALA